MSLTSHPVTHLSPRPSPLPHARPRRAGVVQYPVVERKRGGRAITLSDTPGVLNRHQLTSHLHYEELRAVLPRDSVTPLIYRVEAGQSILVGGLARVDVISGRPFFFASYFAPQVTVHVAHTRAITREYLERNVGDKVRPLTCRLSRQSSLSMQSSLKRQH